MEQKLSIEEKLNKIESLLLCQKDVLTFEEALTYTGLSDSWLYKLTSSRGIPHYKPKGKLLYFKKIELDAWLLSNPIKTATCIAEEAATYLTLSSRKNK